MRYILRYEIESKYLHFVRQEMKEFERLEELRLFLIQNISRIHNYNIYKLSDLTDK